MPRDGPVHSLFLLEFWFKPSSINLGLHWFGLVSLGWIWLVRVSSRCFELVLGWLGVG